MFAVLEYTTPTEFPEAGTLALTMVALLLPLSSLWAGMAADEEAANLDMAHFLHSKHSVHSNGSHTTYTTASSGFDLQSRKGSYMTQKQSIKPSCATQYTTTIDAMGKDQSSCERRDSTEMDLEAMGVRINQQYGVHKA